jgi:hypothetical protein
MKLLPNEMPRPRLLTSIEAAPPPEPATSRRSRRHSEVGFFRNHRTAFLVGTLTSSFLILAATYFLYGRGSIGTEAYLVRQLINVATHTVSSGSHPSRPPAPVTVQLNADIVQVTGIALGHPRLAVINGKQVAEGDTITVHTPIRSITVTLRVLRISDRQVELSDGTQRVVARLVMPGQRQEQGR